MTNGNKSGWIVRRVVPLEDKYKKQEKMARVLISMSDNFLKEIDKIADSENRTRSELIREAFRTYVHKNKLLEKQLKTTL